jgi:hypothetical protein
MASPKNITELTQLVSQLQSQLDNVAAQNLHLKETLDKMTAQNPAPQVAAAPSPEARPLAFPTSRAKYNKPPEFDGRDKAAASTFITHLHLHFLAAPHLFPDDRSKNVFAPTYNRAPA